MPRSGRPGSLSTLHAMAIAAMALLVLLLSSDVRTAPSDGCTPIVAQLEGVDPAFAPYVEPVPLSIAQMLYTSDATLPDGDSYFSNQYTRYIREKLNIDIRVDWVANNIDDYNQKLSLSIVAGNLPDAVLANDRTQMLHAQRLGLLTDITDIYWTYASPQMKIIMDSTDGRAMEAASVDGRMVALPGIQVHADGVHVMWIRKDWLDELGLDVPRTPEQIAGAARAFVENRMGGRDTLGIAGPMGGSLPYANFLESTNNIAGFDPIFSAMDLYPGYWLEDGLGGYEYGSLDPRMKDALALLADWYAGGLIDPELGVRSNSLETINQNRCGIVFAPWWIGYDIQDAVRQNPRANWQAYPVYTEDGRINAHCSAATMRYSLVSADCLYPEAMIKMANLLLRDEGTLDWNTSISWFPLRNPMAAADECEVTILALQRVLSGETSPEDYADTGPYKLLASDAHKIRSVKHPPYDNMDIRYWNLENLGDWGRYYSLLVGGRTLMLPYNRVYSATYTLPESMTSVWPHLRALEYELVYKIIMGQEAPEKFAEFQRYWRGEGGGVLTKQINEEKGS